MGPIFKFEFKPHNDQNALLFPEGAILTFEAYIVLKCLKSLLGTLHLSS
jgi:hypothetical protein